MNVKVIKHTTDSEPSGMLTINAYMQDTTTKKYMHNLCFSFLSPLGDVIAYTSIVSDNSEAISTHNELYQLLNGYTIANPCMLTATKNVYDSVDNALKRYVFTSIYPSSGTTNIIINNSKTTITLSSTGTVSNITTESQPLTTSNVQQIKDFVQEL